VDRAPLPLFFQGLSRLQRNGCHATLHQLQGGQVVLSDSTSKIIKIKRKCLANVFIGIHQVQVIICRIFIHAKYFYFLRQRIADHLAIPIVGLQTANPSRIQLGDAGISFLHADHKTGQLAR